MTLIKKISGYIPAFSMVIIALAIIAGGINIAYMVSAPFADWFNINVSNFFRGFLALLTSWIPFSLAEFILLGSPFIMIGAIAGCVKISSQSDRHLVRCVVGILSVAVAIYVLFVFNFGAGYRGTTLDKKLGLEASPVSAQELHDTMNIVVEKLNELESEIVYAEDIGSVNPYSHDETVKKLLESYALLSLEYDFIGIVKAPVKEIVISDVMTYTHISGVYSFFTGEANVNTNYPYYVRVFTIAHEMAHQRGIARENEANFIAYLACINSSDPYIRYAGYMNMYDYLASPLYKASPSLYIKSVRNLCEGAKYDTKCYSNFFDKYRDSVAAEVSNTVNDTYLKAQGTEGSVSYGMVVDLAVAYHKSELPEQ